MNQLYITVKKSRKHKAAVSSLASWDKRKDLDGRALCSVSTEKAIWHAESKMRREERREEKEILSKFFKLEKKRRSEKEYFLLDMAVFD